MPGNFLDLSRELRHYIYKLTLVDQNDIDFGSWIYPRPISPQLLRTNKMIHHEATSLLYTHNCFYFDTWSPEHLTSFCGKIGSDIAKHVRHIRTDSPMAFGADPGDVIIRDETVHILEMCRSCFPGLKTLTMTLTTSISSAMDLRLNALDNSKIVTEALKLPDTRFRAISSLQEIIIEVHEGGLSDHVRREMNGRGWKISITENAEEEDFDFSDSEDGNYGYDDHTWEWYDDNIYDDRDFMERRGIR